MLSEQRWKTTIFKVLYDEFTETYVWEAVEEVVKGVIRAEVKTMLVPLDTFKDAYNGLRWQYNAKIILEKIEEKFSNFIYLVSKDIYTVEFRYVYGATKVGVGSVISTSRLFAGVPKEWGLSRLEKVVKHELGHFLGLGHCKGKCVMRFSNGLFMLDYKSPYFCDSCKEKLKEALNKVNA